MHHLTFTEWYWIGRIAGLAIGYGILRVTASARDTFGDSTR